MATLEITFRIDVDPTNSKRRTLKAWVSSTSNNLPPEIFVWRVNRAWVPNIGTVDKPVAMPQYSFSHIASLAEIVRYPANTKVEPHQYIRKAFMFTAYTNMKHLYGDIDKLQAFVRQLAEDVVFTEDNAPISDPEVLL